MNDLRNGIPKLSIDHAPSKLETIFKNNPLTKIFTRCYFLLIKPQTSDIRMTYGYMRVTYR